MAYMNQETKKIIKSELDKVVPSDMKYSLRVLNNSHIIMTVTKGSVDFYKNYNGNCTSVNEPLKINQYWTDKYFTGATLELINKIIKALNVKNWNRSDVQTDYFGVGYYVDLQVGSYDKPYILN